MFWWDIPQPNGDTNMPVQMIELEEVTMVETSDDALEALVGHGAPLISYSWGVPPC
jgi:hypothetical protein